MNVGLATLYCVYVLASESSFSYGWFLFWLFFGLIITLSILSILLGIGWIACLISDVSFNDYFGNVINESKEKLINWFNGLHF